MTLIVTNQPETDFNVAATAGMFSTLTGVLAGFSFTGIIFLATTYSGTIVPCKTIHLVGRVLGTSFLGLISMSLCYASLTGATETNGSEIGEEIILAPGFAALGVLLVYAIVLMLEGTGNASIWRPRAKMIMRLSKLTTGPNARTSPPRPFFPIRDMVARWATILATFFVFDAAQDYENLRYRDTIGFLTIIGLAFCVAQLAVSLILYPWWTSNRFQSWSESKIERSTIQLTSIAFAVSVIASLCFVLCDTLSSEDTMLWPFVPIACMATTFLLMSATTYQLARSSNKPVHKTPGDRSAPEIANP